MAKQQRPRNRQRGFVLIAAAIGAVVMIGAMGLAVDLGRAFIVKNEAQAFTDSAAISAAVKLDGSRDGLHAAANAVASSTSNKFDLGQTSFSSVAAEFGTSASGPWESADSAPLTSVFARVRTTAPVALHFLPLLMRSGATTVAAQAVAAQVEKTSLREGAFPFSPFAHNDTGPDFGLLPGELYTLRWPNNPSLVGNKANRICPGDREQAIVDLANAMGGSERGYIELHSANVIRQTIINDYMSITRSVGDLVDFTGGVKQSQLTSLNARVNQDTDHNADSYADYASFDLGNGRRLIVCPINDGGTPAGQNHRIVGFGAFFLSETSKNNGGPNDSWCAEYVGPWVQGSTHKGAGAPGAYVVRLVE